MTAFTPASPYRLEQYDSGKEYNCSSRFISPSAGTPVVSDSYWVPDVEQMDTVRRQKPWRADPHYFTSVSVSLAATVKMFMHGTRGCPDVSQSRFNWFEVMGLLIGHFRGRQLVLTDSFSLPVAASEVECSMTEASQIYMANYLEYHRQLGKAEPGCVGWYHTHPGYSCFLSGIDVTTQQGSQRMQDPWVAVVIDPVETLRTGQFSMKAFRTYPEGYTPPDANKKELGTEEGKGTNRSSTSLSPLSGGASASGGNFGLPPTNRIKDFGMHAHRYYELPVKVVQSSRDAPLWALLQQHFWPLSLSLTFPFAASTRTCQWCAEEVARLTAALAAGMPESSRGAESAASTGVASVVQRGGQHESATAPLLYRSSTLLFEAQGVNDGDGAAGDTERAEELRAAARQLLAVAQDALKVRAESFSLISAAQPEHPEVLQALGIVSQALRKVPTKGTI